MLVTDLIKKAETCETDEELWDFVLTHRLRREFTLHLDKDATYLVFNDMNKSFVQFPLDFLDTGLCTRSLLKSLKVDFKVV